MHDLAARRLDGRDALARTQAGGDDVLDHHDLLAGLDVEAAPQLELAAFTLDEALDDLDLVHEGPLQDFGLRVVAEAGLR